MLYRWNSQLLKEYGLGSIIVHADSVEEARMKARGAYLAYDRPYGEHRAPVWRQEEDWLDNLDKNELDAIVKCYRVFLMDIVKEPETTANMFLIRGSD